MAQCNAQRLWRRRRDRADTSAPRGEHNVKAIYSGANIAVPMENAAMIEMADHELGGVDILVNNAGIQHIAPIEEFPREMGRHHRH
jgi:3-hydroxybutyrate dehydrogenase